MRFTCSTAGTQAVTFANILDSLLVATSATAGFDLFDVVKIKAVEMWSCSTTSGVNTVTVDFAGQLGGVAGDGAQWSDTNMAQQPAHVRAIPSKTCAAGWWQGSSALVAFSLVNCPLNAIIDVECSFRNASVAPVAAAVALVGAAAGQLYYRGLDGQAVAGTKFPAQAIEVI